MSQVESQAGPLKALWGWIYRRIFQRFEEPVRRFEWTWTTAVIFSVGLTLFLVVSDAVLPSFWLYIADQKLRWDGSGVDRIFPPGGIWLKEVRDLIASMLFTGPVVTVIIAAAAFQNWRRKLRGSSGDVRPTGGYR
jgi:hypothetical protein